MLKKLYVDNFRCLVNFELTLSPLTLLLGENGAGKTSVFDVLFLLQRFLRQEGRVDELFKPDTLTRWQSRPYQTFNVEMDGNRGTYLYELVIEHNLEKKLRRVAKERLLFDGKPLFECEQGTVKLYRDDHSPGPQYPFDWTQSGLGSILPRADNQKLTWFKERLSRVVVAGVNPFAMSSEAGAEGPWPTRYLENFSSWFRFLSQERQDRIFDLTQQLREILSGFHSFRLRQSGEEQRILEVAFSDATGRGTTHYRFSELSEGQRVFLVLYTLVFAVRDMDYSLFLDEPENFLGLREIQPWLTLLSDSCGREIGQAVLISHHPELIDYLGASSGCSLEREPTGPTRVKGPPSAGDTGLSLPEAIARGWEQ